MLLNNLSIIDLKIGINFPKPITNLEMRKIIKSVPTYKTAYWRFDINIPGIKTVIKFNAIRSQDNFLDERPTYGFYYKFAILQFCPMKYGPTFISIQDWEGVLLQEILKLQNEIETVISNL